MLPLHIKATTIGLFLTLSVLCAECVAADAKQVVVILDPAPANQPYGTLVIKQTAASLAGFGMDYGDVLTLWSTHKNGFLKEFTLSYAALRPHAGAIASALVKIANGLEGSPGPWLTATESAAVMTADCSARPTLVLVISSISTGVIATSGGLSLEAGERNVLLSCSLAFVGVHSDKSDVVAVHRLLDELSLFWGAVKLRGHRRGS